MAAGLSLLDPLLEPWFAIDDERRQGLLEAELRRELTPDHVLARTATRAVAMRRDCDDVLLEVAGVGLAIVHLTWKGRREISAAWTQRMHEDHADYFVGA